MLLGFSVRTLKTFHVKGYLGMAWIRATTLDISRDGNGTRNVLSLYHGYRKEYIDTARHADTAIATFDRRDDRIELDFDWQTYIGYAQ